MGRSESERETLGRAPEGNGCVERFIRTLKEQVLWVRTVDSGGTAARALGVQGAITGSRSSNATAISHRRPCGRR